MKIFLNTQILSAFFGFCLSGYSILNAQSEPAKFSYSGYVSSMQSAMFDSISKAWVTDNLLHNRINVKYYASQNITGAIELRNRLAFGQGVSQNPNAAANYSADYGLLDLSANIASGQSYVLNSAIDRVWLAYEVGKFKATAGRQRINWGQTFVWNPNDIFNAYSFFDFDYVERPGSDALRLQYYNTEVSATEIACKIDNNKKLTTAALYRFNAVGFDFQVIQGLLASADYVAGAGFSGAVKSLAIRGEASYFHPFGNATNNKKVFLASVGADYTFSNQLTFLAEYLYSNNSLEGQTSFLSFYSAPLTVKNLTFVKHNVVAQFSYPITPLLGSSLAFMYLPGIKGYYLGPSVTYNLAENIDASLYYQGFGAEVGGQRQRFNLLFLRAKVSF